MAGSLDERRILIQPDHQIVVLELQILLLGIVEELDVNLLRDNLRADKVLLGQAKAHLFEDKFNLLPLIHCTICFYLQLLHDRGRTRNIPIRFSDVRQHLR
uniref:Uncharacterized protein n=1 Tax=Anopheles christyi TaxID=43041 RepID=A0A182KJ47_9DIPT